MPKLGPEQHADLLTSIIAELGGASRISWAHVAANMKEDIDKDAARMRYYRWKPSEPAATGTKPFSDKDVDLLTLIIKELGGVGGISAGVAENMKVDIYKDAARMRYNRWKPKETTKDAGR